MTVEAAAQLEALVSDRLDQIAPATGIRSDDGPVGGNIRARCAQIVAELAQDADDRLAAEACLAVMAIAWPAGDPDDDPDWWISPLGRLCARSFGRDDSDAVTHAVAASMLGLARGSIGPMITRGQLDRHPDGGVVRSSVLRRLGR